MTNLKTALLLSLAALGVASAQNAASPIKLTGFTMLVTPASADGKTEEKLSDVAGKGVNPGNVLELGQKIENTSKMNVNNVRLNMPLSAAVAYTSQKCSTSATAAFSIDGKTYANPLKKTVTVTENGKSVTKEVNVEPSEYKFVRWTLPTIKSGEVVNCAVRAKVK